MAGLVSVTPSTLKVAVATFNGAVDPTTVLAAAWAVTAPAGGQPVTVVKVEVQPGNLVLSLFLATQLTPGGAYTFVLTGGKDAGGVAINPASAVGNAPAGALALGLEWPHGVLEAVTQAAAEEIQTLGGVPATILVADLADTDTVAFVESTLGFASKGAFWAAGRRYTYTGKADCSLTGIVYDSSNGQTIPAGAMVVLDARAVLPD